MERAQTLLAQGASLITLLGPSGIGKTRLARQLAARLLALYDEEGGVWFCSLSECRSAADLEATVARTLGIHHRQGDALARGIANRGPLLLILDNADPISTQSGGVVARWRERCVELQMIVTSLTRLGVEGEHVIELRPLDPDDAVALYLDRAHRAWADRTFSGEEASDVHDLVRRLDRLPLAIELAAARVRILPPRTMLSMFEKRFDLLRASSPQPDPHLRRDSLVGALELTWNHLEPVEQLALARASVFEGGFTLEAALAVLDDQRGRTPGSHSILEDLYRKSLLSIEESEPPRFYLLESVKAYALQALRQMGRWDEAIRRHAAYFLDGAERETPLFQDPTRSEAIPLLKRERENLIAIHRRFLTAEPSLAARAGIALGPLIISEGYTPAEAELLTTTIQAARASGKPKLILAALEVAHATHFRFGRFAEARAAMNELVELAHAEGEREWEAYTLSRLAILHLDKGDLVTCRPLLERASQLANASVDPTLRGAILLATGTEAISQEAYGRAEAKLLQAIELLRGRGSRGIEANALYTLGIALANQGRHLEARELLQGAVQICRELGDRSLEAHILANLARFELGEGHLDEAEDAGSRSLAIRREFTNPFREGALLTTLGMISMERGDLDAAARHLSRAELILQTSRGDGYAEVQLFLSILEVRRQHLDEAGRLLDEARSRLEGSGTEANLLIDGAEAFHEVGQAWALLGTRPEAAEAKATSARSRLQKIRRRRVHASSHLPVVVRVLEEALAGWDRGASPPVMCDSQLLEIGGEADWFRVASQEPIALRNRRVLRRIVLHLVEKRLASPGLTVEGSELIEAGWPGTDPAEDGAINRLHVAIWTLRDLGLRSVIRNAGTGYLLDPEIPLRRIPG